MRNLWVRIGLGAGIVFLAGMFVLTLGRQVKANTVDAFRHGGTVKVPFSILPFTIDGHKVGSVQQVQVVRQGDAQARRVNVVVNLKGVDPGELGDCAMVVGRHEFFSCVPLSEIDRAELLAIGEVRFEPAGVVRPILIERGEVDQWFEGDAQAYIQAEAGGANIDIQGADGSQFKLQAGEGGAIIRVTKDGKEVMKLDATEKGVELKVDAKADKP